MSKKLAALAVAGALLVAIGCSKSETASTTTTAAAAAGGSSTTKAGASKAAIPKATNLPKVTKPAAGATLDRSTAPSLGLQSALGISAEEEDCVLLIVVGASSEDPTLMSDANKLAGALGASMVACIPQDKLAKALVTMMGQGGKLDATQKSCLENEFASASPDDMALFLGILMAAGQAGGAAGDALLQPYKEALSTACSIPMS